MEQEKVNEVGDMVTDHWFIDHYTENEMNPCTVFTGEVRQRESGLHFHVDQIHVYADILQDEEQTPAK